MNDQTCEHCGRTIGHDPRCSTCGMWAEKEADPMNYPDEEGRKLTEFETTDRVCNSAFWLVMAVGLLIAIGVV